MTAPVEDDGRDITPDGSQGQGEGQVGGPYQSRGPALSPGGEQEPGGVVPPYDGRKETAEPDQEGATYRDGARVGGATGPVDDDEYKAPSPSDTPGGRTASPSDEQPAGEMPEPTAPDEGSEDVTAHGAGVPKGEGGGS